MQAQHLHDHFVRTAPWVSWQSGPCDGFKYGDPATVVQGIAVAWQALQGSLEEAHAKGCNLFITHEPTFYSHMDDDEALKSSPPALRKKAFLDRAGIVVYRCHDTWDVFPQLGVVDAWSAFLGLGEPVSTARYYNVHALPPTTAWQVVRQVAERVSSLQEQAVQFLGKKSQIVSRIAVGTGAITDVRRMIDLGADMVIATDDGTTFWRDGAWMADSGIPLIVVNHMTAEIPGLHGLVTHLRTQFPDVPVEFVGPSCSYEILACERAHDPLAHMRRRDLEGLPALCIPQGYSARPMQADEVWAYLEVMRLSGLVPDANMSWFEHAFAGHPGYDVSRHYLIWKGDRPVAAATAWLDDVEGQHWGRVHWVGVADSEKGRGLGRAVALAALHRMRTLGHTRALLDTQAWRLSAVATYLSLGFEPWPTEETPRDVWDRALADLADWRAQARRET
ncbi:MAG: Nif3-like dinuclear metal center hexameric protein [Anaerolineae bacterium]